jgi:hypothetical protein
VRPRLELLGGQPLEIGDVDRLFDAGRLFRAMFSSLPPNLGIDPRASGLRGSVRSIREVEGVEGAR